MNIAVLKDGVCVDAAVFDDIVTAGEFLLLGVWPDADEVAELPEGYGIGDSYARGEWEKAEQPEPLPPPEPAPDIDELAEAVRILTGGADDELDTIISDNS